MVQLQFTPNTYRKIDELNEETSGVSTKSSPTNNPEARLLRLLRDHHFPEGQCQIEIKTTAGLPTRPDWIHESTKVAIYLDGMSRHLHGDPKTAQRDQLIRQMLELDGYQIIVIQSRDLNDPQAVRLHLRNIARAISRNDLAEMISAADMIAITPEVAAENAEVEVVESTAKRDGDELLEYADERCRSFLQKWVVRKLPLPIVGFGLQDDEGIVIAEAELAWPEQKIVALFSDAEGKEAFEAVHWQVYDAADLEENLDELMSKMGAAE